MTKIVERILMIGVFMIFLSGICAGLLFIRILIPTYMTTYAIGDLISGMVSLGLMGMLCIGFSRAIFGK